MHEQIYGTIDNHTVETSHQTLSSKRKSTRLNETMIVGF